MDWEHIEPVEVAISQETLDREKVQRVKGFIVGILGAIVGHAILAGCIMAIYYVYIYKPPVEQPIDLETITVIE